MTFFARYQHVQLHKKSSAGSKNCSQSNKKHLHLLLDLLVGRLFLHRRGDIKKMWTTEDLLWLTTNYPSLKQKTSNIIEGRLSFRMLRLNGKYVVNPGSDLLARTKTKDYLYIFDTYNVRIEWKKDHTLPIVFETGGKLADVAKLLNKRLIDMHQFEDG